MMYILVTVNLIVLSVVLINWIKWRPISPLPHISGPCVSVLIPARNEEKNIACAIQSALEQGAIVQEILVYDDHSEDQTQPIVCALEKETPTLQLIEPAPLPDGWMGKPFACEQLSAKATGEWLLFLDADTRLHPGAAEAMLQAAETREATFLSCWPGILTGSFWEHIFMPMLNFVVYSIFPTPMQEKNPSPSFGLAHGACLFIHGKTYRATGGHASVKSELFEDTMLARTWRQKKTGGPLPGWPENRVGAHVSKPARNHIRVFKDRLPGLRAGAFLLALHGLPLSFHAVALPSPSLCDIIHMACNGGRSSPSGTVGSMHSIRFPALGGSVPPHCRNGFNWTGALCAAQMQA